MAVQLIISGANANANKFQVVKTPKGSFTIDATTTTLVGSPTWTLMVSNSGTTEADFKEYSAGTTGLAMTDFIESNKLNFEYIAIKFTSNTSTGTYSFYIGEQ